MALENGSWVVLKFGGTSVASKERWESVRTILNMRLKEGLKPLLVCSAISGVSNLLTELLEKAPLGDSRAILDEIKGKHIALVNDLGLSGGESLISDQLELLERLVTGISLIGHADPRTSARIMALGELMLTKIGCEYLSSEGFSVGWRDASRILRASPKDNRKEELQYLSAVCESHPDPELRHGLAAGGEDIIMTQGFIAGNQAGETVLLGRGGSDTSASYFGAMLSAVRVEIWTDVPGMFSSNPREVPSARLLLKLDYEEAQELATSGAKVLHPRCIDPVRAYDIPLSICWTERPDFRGMQIGPFKSSGPAVKAVIAKKDIHMISMETLGMWHQVGFLARVFDCFKKHGFSIDLVATSQSNVTVTLDSIANIIDPAALDRLKEDLSDFCKPVSLGPVAAVSLVGKNIRSMIHKLGPSLEAFEEKKIYLISQAASDLNFTFTIDEDEAGKITQKLHALFFSDLPDDDLFGPTWDELFNKKESEPALRTHSWWAGKRERLIEIATKNSPVYVYDQEELESGISALKSLSAVSRLHYALKANAHPEIVKLFYRQGLGFDCVSVEEISYLKSLIPDLDYSRVLFTPNFAPAEEYRDVLKLGCHLTLDNIFPLEKHPDIFAGTEILVRIDPEVGRGHHKHVRTAGPSAKFGIAISETDRLLELARKAGCRITGLHAHVGSGIRSPETWAENALFLAKQAEKFRDVKVLNLGGGLGVVEKPGQKPLDLSLVNQSLMNVRKACPGFELWLEPGRYLVAQAGVLLAKVTQLKSKGEKKFVGIDAGMNSLIRPSLYGSYHEIINLSQPDAPRTIKADVVGPICETGDVLGHSRNLPVSEEGDVILIGTAGAYGRVMASAYNQRQPAREVFLGSPQY